MKKKGNILSTHHLSAQQISFYMLNWNHYISFNKTLYYIISYHWSKISFYDNSFGKKFEIVLCNQEVDTLAMNVQPFMSLFHWACHLTNFMFLWIDQYLLLSHFLRESESCYIEFIMRPSWKIWFFVSINN